MPKMPRTGRISMTRQAYSRLNAELAALRGRPSLEVPDDYMDTDEVRDDYRTRRSRIGVIEKLLAGAIVDDKSADDVMAAPGAVVTVHHDDTGDTETFVLGDHGVGDDDNKIYPLRSPIGRVVAGARPGQHRTTALPGGRRIAVTLLKVELARSTMTNHRSPTMTRSCRRRPKSPGTTAAGLHELLNATPSTSKHVETHTLPRVRAALHPSVTNAVRTSVCGTSDRQAGN